MNEANSKTCGVCGTPSRAPFRAPQPELAPDMDMRPGEPARSTLVDWVQTCPKCGAAAPDLSTLPSTARAVALWPSPMVALTTSSRFTSLPPVGRTRCPRAPRPVRAAAA